MIITRQGVSWLVSSNPGHVIYIIHLNSGTALYGNQAYSRSSDTMTKNL